MNPETTLCWHPLQEGLVALRQACLRAKEPPPHWDRVENCAGFGYPDLSWAWTRQRALSPSHVRMDRLEGHIELKYRAAPPVRTDTPVVVESITPHQRLWWKERWEAGGNVFVLLRLAEEYLLFPGLWARTSLGTVPLAELREQARIIVPRSQVRDRAGEILEAACR